MSEIRTLFDQDIGRRIEKVIQYQTTDADLLKQEVAEYVATPAIESSLERLLDQIDDAMSSPSEQEVGVWVSGFYGSGKSSFTKYLGYALDSAFAVDGTRFRELLKRRLPNQPLQQRLETVATLHDPVVILVDLSVDSFADAQTMPVSTVLFLRVLSWAGYSRELKIAYLEMLAEEQGRLDELRAGSTEFGWKWEQIQDNPVVANQIGAKLACRMFPKLFTREEEFKQIRITEAVPEQEQVRRMLDLIRRRTGREKVIFVVDEIGQYVAHSDTLVLNLQGLAQNLKAIGRGRAWILATAQQTLTDDAGPLQAPKLFKLKDRFPVTVELRADDIKEITHRRLLSKTPQARKTLASLYAAHGSRLNALTRLENARGYTTTVQESQFVDLYPFLPQHFDLMMNIIARLARSTGGTGLRSAIKVVQETLLAGEGKDVLARQLVGSLVTVGRFYDVLRADLERSPQVRHGVECVDRTVARYGPESREAAAARAVAVTQILDDFPLTRANLAALMVARVDAEEEREAVSGAVDTLLADPSIPLEEVDGRLRFLSERASSLAADWRRHQPTGGDMRQVLGEALKESLLAAPPKATIFGTKSVRAAVKVEYGDYPLQLHEAGDGLTVTVRIVDPSAFADERSRALNGSTAPASEKTIVALAAAPASLTSDIRDVYASNRMTGELRGRTLDADEREFFQSLPDRKRAATQRITDALTVALEAGTVIFRGQDLPVKSTAASFVNALSAAVEKLAVQVYAKYEHAAVTVQPQAAEKIVRATDPATITSVEDPLGLLCGGAGGGFNAAHPAVVDVLDYLGHRGSVDGRTLLDDFSRDPWGWNKDVTRYVVAAMFAGGHLSLRIDSRTVTTASPAVAEVLKSNVAFARVGVDSPPAPPPQEAMGRARNLLVELTGKMVTPLPARIEEAAREAIDSYADRAAVVLEIASGMGLGVRAGVDALAAELRTLGSATQDAVIRAFGDDQGTLGSRLSNLKATHELLTGPFRKRLSEVRDLLGAFERLPQTAQWTEVREQTEQDRKTLAALLSDPDLPARQAQIQGVAGTVCDALTAAIDREWSRVAARQEEEAARVRGSADWRDLTVEARETAGGMLDHLVANSAPVPADPQTPAGARLRDLVNRQLEAEALRNAAREYVARQAEESRSSKADVTYLIVPAGELEVAEARQALSALLFEVEAAPAETRVRFRAQE